MARTITQFSLSLIRGLLIIRSMSMDSAVVEGCSRDLVRSTLANQIHSNRGFRKASKVLLSLSVSVFKPDVAIPKEMPNLSISNDEGEVSGGNDDKGRSHLSSLNLCRSKTVETSADTHRNKR